MCDSCRSNLHEHHEYDFVVDIAPVGRSGMQDAEQQCRVLSIALQSRMAALTASSNKCGGHADRVKQDIARECDGIGAALELKQQLTDDDQAALLHWKQQLLSTLEQLRQVK